MAVELSIIVPARYHLEGLRTCLQSLINQSTSYGFEIIVAYCEQDRDIDRVVQEFSNVQTVTSREFLFPGQARNLGASRAAADVLAFIDSDCKVHSEWVTQALNTIKNGAVLCSGAILDTFHWDLIASSDNRLQYADFPGGRPYGPSTYFPGAHLAVRRDVFEGMEGFTNTRHADDVMFTIAVADKWPGLVIFNPGMIVSHAGRRTLSALLQHHETFGHERAFYQIQINSFMAWVSKYPWLGWVLFLRRFVYISLRVLQWNFTDLPRYILQTPFILAGLTAWVGGYYRGTKEVKR